MTDEARPDVEAELQQLKDFQRRTVEHVDRRLWDVADPARRFLLADEVGLGKTLVARGVIAKTIDRLWDKGDRIDVIYICSSTQIARQNLPKLQVGSTQTIAHADRLTMLATELRHIGDRRLNFVSFTPGTSFQVGSSGGRAPERVLLYWLLREAWGSEINTKAWTRFFRGGSGFGNFRYQLGAFDLSELTSGLVEDFAEQLRVGVGPDGGNLADELRSSADEFRYQRKDWKPPIDISSRRNRLIGRLRHALARSAVTALEPDLVILDEFQRFKDLMHGQDEGAELAHALFDHGDARLLLMSATPYKMYTLPDEPEGDDHYKDFTDTVRFLANDERASTTQVALSEMRNSLYAGDIDAARVAKRVAENELRRIMVRTERLASTPDRDGMVTERTLNGVRLDTDDVRDYRRLFGVSKVVSGFDPLEFWRSSPYVLELMERYELKKKLEAHPVSDRELMAALEHGGRSLSWQRLESYTELDPANAKMRGLVADVLDRGAWKLAWIPPSMPYYELSGPYADTALASFTKRLVFSAWAVVPKAISTVISYEAERRLMSKSTTTAAQSYSSRGKPLLNFSRSKGRLTGMPVLGLLYPCVTLAEIGDPLVIAREQQLSLPMGRERYIALVTERIRSALARLPASSGEGPVDDRWYWAAGMILDAARDDLGGTDADTFSYGLYAEDDTTDSLFDEHAAHAPQIGLSELGRQPQDLVDVLVGTAVGGLGVCALRSLSRVMGGTVALRDETVRDTASSMAWNLRGVFNKPEVIELVRSQSDEDSYWREVQQHGVDGGLQAVLDEYVHTLRGALTVSRQTRKDGLGAIAEEFHTALAVRTSVSDFSELSLDGQELRLEKHQSRLRSHFAVRFGRGVAEDAKAQREGQVRSAFNSPFWPFVLASTSVGQEGLDFHHYSHAVVHWNLPRNPVDLEQREGRVHRYKGHAVRKNVAKHYGSRLEVLAGDDPWEAAFNLAAADRPSGESEMFPYWIFPDPSGASIERYIPALPLSSETHRARRLMRTVGAYRLVLGQPRQEDLLRYLGDKAEDLLQDLQIDLSPPDSE